MSIIQTNVTCNAHYRLNYFKPSGKYMCPATCSNNQYLFTLPTDGIYGFRMIIKVNSDYFP
jgi:hypothetical protein